MVRWHRIAPSFAVAALVAGSVVIAAGSPASAATVSTEAQLRTEFGGGTQTSIVLANDIDLTDCKSGPLHQPPAAAALVVDGSGFTINQTCTGERVMQTEGLGITLQDITVTGGNDDAGAGQGIGGGIFNNGSGPLTLDGATVTGNRADGVDGGIGGGWFSNGTVTVTSSIVTNNVSGGGTSIFNGLGGAMAGNAGVTITDSTISDNTAEGGETNGGGAGAIFGNAPVTLVRSTMSGNRALAGTTSGSGSSGAIGLNDDLTLIDSTVTGNAALGPDSTTGGIGAGGAITLVYSTVVGNSSATGAANARLSANGEDLSQSYGSVIALPLGGATNCAGDAIDSHGYSFSDDDTCGFTNTGAGDKESAGDPMLSALGANGGPTMTRVPQTGSPLIDAIPTAACQSDGASGVTTDERGITRPQVAGCDIGAVEVSAVVVTPTTIPGAGPAGGVEATPAFTG